MRFRGNQVIDIDVKLFGDSHKGDQPRLPLTADIPTHGGSRHSYSGGELQLSHLALGKERRQSLWEV